MKSHTIEYSIRTCDVDIRKNYKAFAFMTQAQEIANYHASAIGFGYADLIKSNIVWVLSRMKVKYIQAPVWEDSVQMTTWHKGREGVFSLRDFEVCRKGEETPVIQATSSWLLIDASSRKMLRPDHVLGEKSTSTAWDKDAVAEPCGKIRTPNEEDLYLIRSHEVLFSDIDFNSHTNNAKYVEWAFDAIDPAVLTEKEIDCYQINFNHETRLGDTVDLYRAVSGVGKYYVEGRCGEKTVFQTSICLK